MKWSTILLLALLAIYSTACKDTPSATVRKTPPSSQPDGHNESATNTANTTGAKGNSSNLVPYVPFKESDVVDFKNRMKQPNTVLIDVRTPGEVKKGTIDGAINMNVLDKSFLLDIRKLDKEKTYLLFCATGMRSMRAARQMAETGFTHVYSLTGGLGAWNRVNNELEK